MQIEEQLLPTYANELFRSLINNLNNNYVHWEKFKDMQLPDGQNAGEVWQAVIAERDQGYFRKLHFDCFDIKWWLSNTLEAQLHRLDIGIGGGRGLDLLLESKHTHRYRTSALLDESITSAQLTGAAVSKKVAKEMLLKKRSPQNVSEQICVNIFKATQWGFNKKEDVLSETLLQHLHHILTKDTLKLKSIGQYRTNNKVDLTGLDLSANYKPIDSKNISQSMTFLFDLYNNDNDSFFIHPLIKAAIIHYFIIYLRPFKDANGRIARLVAQMYLLKKGYWVAEFISVSNIISKLKPQYYKSIVQSQSDGNNIGYFIRFYIQSVQMAYKGLRDFVLRISKEKSDKNTYKRPGYNERQTAVLQWIKEDPDKTVTIRELRSVYGVSKETARTDLNELVEKGWIKYFNINKKAYAFVKGDGFNEQEQSHG